MINEVNLPSSSATSIPLDSISKIPPPPNEVNHAQNFLGSEPTPIPRPANQVDATSQVCLNTMGDKVCRTVHVAVRVAFWLLMLRELIWRLLYHLTELVRWRVLIPNILIKIWKLIVFGLNFRLRGRDLKSLNLI